MNKVIYENTFIKVTDTEQEQDCNYRILFENKTDRPITVIGSGEVENVEIPAYSWIGLLYGEQALEWIKIIEAKDFCSCGQGIIDKDLKDWGFNPLEDEEDVEYDVALGCNEDDYVLTSNGNIEIKKSLVDESFRKIGKELLIWFVDEDDPLHTYRVVEVTDDKVIAEFID